MDKGITKLLEYVNTTEAIIDYVHQDDKLSLSELKDKNNFTDESKNFLNNIKNLKPHTVFINESGLYSLILRSKMKKAKDFQRWVTSKVLPSLRKTGEYSIEQIKQLENQLKETKLQLSNSEDNNQKTKEKLIKDELQTLDKFIYIASSKNYMKENIFKVGGTKNVVKRLISYNTERPYEDRFFCLYQRDCRSYRSIEYLLKSYMGKYLYQNKTEVYKLPFDILKDFLDTIIDMDNELMNTFNNETLNRIFESRFNHVSVVLPNPMPNETLDPETNKIIYTYMFSKPENIDPETGEYKTNTFNNNYSNKNNFKMFKRN